MTFEQYLQQHAVYMDGGMGTLLQQKGLQPGEAPERWNLTRADEIVAIHRAYFEAGSNLVCTNTFGANLLKYPQEQLDAVIEAAVRNARTAQRQSGVSHPTFVALDVGPLGKLLAPLGDLDFEEAVKVFSYTIEVGARCGVDAVLIETMNDSYETKAALLAAKERCDLPVLVSNAYGEDGKLMTGATPAAMVALAEGLGAAAVGANCSLGPKQLRGVAEELLQYASIPVLLKPNAGLPREENGRTVFDVLPEDFACEVTDLMHRGVRMAGGCCGTTPAYIKALCVKTQGFTPVPLTDKGITAVSSYSHAVCFGADPLLIGERINPTGKKRFKQALLERDMGYILNEAVHQQEKGVHLLDVNVGLPEIDEVQMLCDAVCQLQAVTDLPLQIDTADAAAMEAALRRYNGKAMVNSVNGKQQSMQTVFPLVKKYGGVVVALTLDENGIPADAAGRVAIAQRILETAARYGIAKKDIVFDPLAMTVSADATAAAVTLQAVRRIRDELGCPVSLGVSNVSFGLPKRDAVNGTFFALALENGLSAAIMNPYSADMMKCYYAYRALKGLDANCADYVQAAQGFGETAAVTAVQSTEESGASALQRAIIKGFKEEAAALTRARLADTEAMCLVNGDIIPALNTVGAGFENKTVYLPQLLMSAEAAQSAFEVIKASVCSGEQTQSKGIFVLATVQGDIHDIGKNIVRLLLENYGFTVVDLGKDVPPETVADTAVRLHAPLVGLSALMTTTVPAMEQTIQLLRQRAPWCKTVVGGAVLTEAYAQKIGADKYAKDAMEAVRYALHTLQA